MDLMHKAAAYGIFWAVSCLASGIYGYTLHKSVQKKNAIRLEQNFISEYSSQIHDYFLKIEEEARKQKIIEEENIRLAYAILENGKTIKSEQSALKLREEGKSSKTETIDDKVNR